MLHSASLVSVLYRLSALSGLCDLRGTASATLRRVLRTEGGQQICHRHPAGVGGVVDLVATVLVATACVVTACVSTVFISTVRGILRTSR